MSEISKIASVVASEIRGKVGTEVFSRNTFGAYSYTWAPRVDPNTALQQVTRISMIIANQYWMGIPETWRTAWQTYADNVPRANRVGKICRLTGRQVFLSTVLIRASAGQMFPTASPTIYTRAKLRPPTYVPYLGAYIKVFYHLDDRWRTEDLGVLVVYSSPAQTDQVNYYKGPFRRIGTAAGDPVSPPTMGYFRPAWPPVPGRRRIYFRVRCVNRDNRTSPDIITAVQYP